MPLQFLRIVWCLLPLLLATTPLRAQDTPAAPQSAIPTPTAEEVEAGIAQVENDEGGDQAARDAVLAIYRETLDALKRRDEAEARRAESERLIAEAPALLASIRAELANPPAEPSISAPPDATLGQLEQGLAEAQVRLTAARESETVFAAEGARRDERRAALVAQIADLRRRLAETADAYEALADSDASPAAQAERMRLGAREAQILSEIAAAEKEALSYTARADLLPARRDLALRRITEAERVVEAWQALVARARQADAARAAREAERLEQQAALQHEVLREFADENIRLANLRVGEDGTSARPEAIADKAEEIERQLATIREGYRSVQARIRASDLNRATGLLLRNQYALLPEADTIARDLSNIESHLETAELTRIDLEEKRRAAGDINRVVEELLAAADRSDAESGADRAALEAAARELATNRLDTLDNLLMDADKEVLALYDLAEATAQLHEAVVAYRAYIEERILWIRSIAGETLAFIPEFADAAAWLVDVRAWEAVLGHTLAHMRASWSPVAAATLLVALSFLVRRVASRRLLHYADLVGNYKTDSLLLTVKALLYTLAASFFLPTVFMVVGWLLTRPSDQLPLGVAVGQAFSETTSLVFVLSFSRAAVRRGGLFASHFRWPNAAVAHLRRELRWFMPVVIPIVLLSHTFENHSDDGMIATLGRVAFTAHMVALSIFVGNILRPGGPTMSEYFKRTSYRIVHGSRYGWYILAIIIPLALAGMSWFGYHYTAIALFDQVQRSLFLLVILITVYAVMLRWLFVTRRSVAIATAKRRREQVQVEPLGPDQPAPVDEDRLDLPAISAQTRQIFGLVMVVAVLVGFYSIWAPVLPALRMFDRVEVWPNARVVGAEEDSGVPVLEQQPVAPPSEPGDRATETRPAAPAGDARQASEPNPLTGVTSLLQPSDAAETTPAEESPAEPAPEETLVVTLADIGLAIVILVATILAFKNIPGLFEILVLHRLPLDAGIRYALSTVLRYVIAIIGISIAFSAIGLAWNNIQWLAAALTFGLAFGLQEIFANFVSGLIILAERPVRIGDTITVGTTTGDVTRIRMRATTITDWERKELIIPNKSFITGDVINWTLTDPMLRITIPVGVAYSSDIDKVERVLLRIAQADPVVLKDPAPYVLFNAFGDSTLDFQLRVFIPSIKNFVEVRHRLHMTIMKTFTAEEIEISFPQRDLHIRSSDAEFLVKRPSSTAPNDPAPEPPDA